MTVTLTPTRLAGALRRGWRTDPALLIGGLAMPPVLLACLIGLAVDPTVITGAPAWLKPAKFAVSITLYDLTLLWVLGQVRGHRRAVRTIGAVVSVSLVVEMALIGMQVLRGTTSHFNVETAFDTAVYAAMGVTIVAVFVATMVAAVLVLRQQTGDAALDAGLRLGLTGALLGMLAGIAMTAANGSTSSPAGAHTVGASDGGPGLPIVGWSTVAGDYRVSHFVGLHALQALPLLVWALHRLTRLTAAQQHRLVLTAGAGWLGLTALLGWQAARGQSVVAADLATAAAFAVLAGAVAAGIRWSLHLARVRRATYGGVDQTAPEQGDAGTAIAVAISPSRTTQRPSNPVRRSPSTSGPGTDSRAENVSSTGSMVTAACSKPNQPRASGNHAL